MTIPDITTPTRKCTKCHETYPATVEHFNRSKAGKYGLNSVCRSCISIRAAIYRDENRDKIREYDKQKKRKYYAANPEKFREEKRRQRRDKPELERESGKRYRKKNEVELKARKKRYRENRREVVYASNARRRAREYSAEGSWTAADIELQKKCQTDRKGKLRCWWCKRVLKEYHRDHRIPLDKGGSNYPNNICLCCPLCNSQKKDKMPWEWIGRLL